MAKKVGFIPLRKGSKGIRNKNKKKIVGRPLFSWVLTEAVFSDLDTVYVYTDDTEIIEYIEREYGWTDKVKAMMRSEESASDTASTEFALLEFCERVEYDFDVFCLLQATSPMTRRTDINNCLDKLNDNAFDSALTVVKTHRFIWNKDGTPQNYDYLKRPRRQDFDGLLIENGAVYTSTKNNIRENQNRIGGRVALVEMDEESLVEIDSLSDWNIVEQLLVDRLRCEKKPEQIKHLLLDVDGVFTDGCVYFNSDGEFLKKFDMRDGMGLEILRQHDVDVIVITSENSELVAQRMKKLKIDKCYFGVKDKYALLNKLRDSDGLNFNNLAYIGDDINDLASMLSVGWSFAPKNAMKLVKQHADFTLDANSAEGAIRSVCEHIIKYNKRYEKP
ncbi:MAG TPA: HAD hydrolase family protein [Flavobacterium sp.]|jgi:N-acylneuraminate cytidylyltransferase